MRALRDREMVKVDLEAPLAGSAIRRYPMTGLEDDVVCGAADWAAQAGLGGAGAGEQGRTHQDHSPDILPSAPSHGYSG
jgi:hypothetical protein